MQRGSLELAPGEVIDGRFEITRTIGHGGLATVYEAIDHEEGRRVAVKMLKPCFASDPFIAARFAREAQISAKVESRNVCVAFHSGTTESGASYLVMERLRGRTLGETLVEEGPMSPARAASILIDVCDALERAHALGIVHRDLKPDNVFLAIQPDGSTCVKLIDFGLSKSPDELGVTSGREILGTPIYMSPDQLMAPQDVDGRADLWSVGVMLYEMLSGAKPFRAESVQRLVLRIVLDAPHPFDDASVPDNLRAIVARCLEKKREDRWDTASDLAEALVPFLDDAAPMTMRSAAPAAHEGAVTVRRTFPMPMFVVMREEPCPETLPDRTEETAFVVAPVLRATVRMAVPSPPAAENERSGMRTMCHASKTLASRAVGRESSRTSREGRPRAPNAMPCILS